jgi:predicted permease
MPGIEHFSQTEMRGIAIHTLSQLLGRFAFGLDTAGLRSAVMTAAMAPGVNAYIFANLYGVAKRVAASTVLVATALSIGTIWLWLQVLP